LFPSRTGRPSLPADLVGSVLVLKELYDLSDPQAADALKFDIRWKVARPVADRGELRPVRAGVLAAADRRLAAAGPGVRRGSGGDRRDRDPGRAAQAVRGLDRVRRRRGDPFGAGEFAGANEQLAR
jgi:hypothetical protein